MPFCGGGGGSPTGYTRISGADDSDKSRGHSFVGRRGRKLYVRRKEVEKTIRQVHSFCTEFLKKYIINDLITARFHVA